MNIQCTSVRLDQFTYLGIISSVSIPVPSGSFLLWASDTFQPSTPWVGAAPVQSSQVSPEFNKWYFGEIFNPRPGSLPGAPTVALASSYLLVKGFGPGASHGGSQSSPHIMGSVNRYQLRFCKQTNNQTQTVHELNWTTFLSLDKNVDYEERKECLWVRAGSCVMLNQDN